MSFEGDERFTLIIIRVPAGEVKLEFPLGAIDNKKASLLFRVTRLVSGEGATVRESSVAAQLTHSTAPI